MHYLTTDTSMCSRFSSLSLGEPDNQSDQTSKLGMRWLYGHLLHPRWVQLLFNNYRQSQTLIDEHLVFFWLESGNGIKVTHLFYHSQLICHLL